MVSSRKQQNVDKAVEKLKEDSINVAGMVCHVGKEEDRRQIIQEVGHNAICNDTISLTALLRFLLHFLYQFV